MKKSFLSVLVIFTFIFAFFSCSDGLNDYAKKTDSADGKTYLVVGSASMVQRTLKTKIDLDDLSSFVLKRSLDSDQEEVLASADSLEELKKEQIEIEVGLWDFTLSAQYTEPDTASTITFSGSTSEEIEAGKVNSISFVLEAEDSFGGLSITVEFEIDKSVSRIETLLTKLDTGTEIETKTIEADSFVLETGTDGSGTASKYAVTYSRNAAAENERLEKGYYHLVLDFYADGLTEKLNTLDYYIRVTGGLTTNYKQTVLLNEIYTITYEYNGGILPEGTALPGKYSRKSETINLPTMEIIEKTDWIFDGWYTDSAFTEGNEISEIATGRTGDLTLYAKWHERKTEDNPFSVSINVNSSEIDVDDNADVAVENKSPELQFSAASTVEEKAIVSYEWTLDGKEVGSGSNLSLNASDWLSGIYTLSLVAKDEDGDYYSYLAQIEWIRLYKINFVIDGAPAGTEEPVQYVRQGDKIITNSEPTYGWYTDEGFSKYYDIEEEPTHSMTLYGCWDLGGKIYVSGWNGCDPDSDIEKRGTAGLPFASIEAASSLIDDSELDYTIYIDYRLQGYQKLPSSLDGMAKSITLCGQNDDGRDMLSGELPDDEMADSVLTISTSVPVTIRNLTISKGKNGITIGATDTGTNSEVTLGEGCLVTDNIGASGVYLASGKLTIDGASISNNTSDSGGGVRVTGGNFIMTSGSISGNTASSTNDVGERGGGGVSLYGSDDSPVSFMMEGGTISANKASLYGGGVSVLSNAEFIMTGGTIGGETEEDGNKLTESGWSTYGGGVYIASEASFVMEGGLISYNSTSSQSDSTGGGAVCVYSGTFEMSDGRLENNSAAGSGGAVFVDSNGTFDMSGGSISGNKAGEEGHGNGAYINYKYNLGPGTVKMGGSASLSATDDVYLIDNIIIITDELTEEAPVVTITPNEYASGKQVLALDKDEEGNVITSTTLAAASGKIAVTAKGQTEWLVTEEGTLRQGASPTIYVTAKTLEEGESDTGDGSEEAPFANIQNAINQIVSNNKSDWDYTVIVSGLTKENVGIGAIYSDDDGWQDKPVVGKSITLQGKEDDGTCGIGEIVEFFEPMLYITTSVPVILTDFTIKPASSVNTGAPNYGKAIYVASGSDVTLSGATLLDGSATQTSSKTGEYYGAVYVRSGKFTMTDSAKITGWTMANGGGIYVDGEATVNLSGNSSITSCTGTYGGGIYVKSGSVNMSENAVIGGAEGKGCTAASYGGGVYLASGSVTMSGYSAINYNNVNLGSGGGGVAMVGGSFTMDDSSTICYNEDKGVNRTAYGGGVYVTDSSVFTMKGNSIIGYNTATTTYASANAYGGGVYLYGSEAVPVFDMQGGYIADNTASATGTDAKVFGSGVCVEADSAGNALGTFKMRGSVVLGSSDDVYTSKIVIAGPLSDISGAKITPAKAYDYDYTEGKQILEIADGADTTLEAEYGKFTVAQPADTTLGSNWRVKSDGTITKDSE